MLRAKLLLVFLTILTFSTLGQAPQSDAYITSIRHIGVEDGLAGRVVNCGIQDSRGFIWLGTKYGLNRYDGQEFTLYTLKKDGLQSNEILEIQEDNNGFIWVFYVQPGYEDRFSGQVDLINVKTWEIIPLPEEVRTKIGLSDLELGHVAKSNDGRLVFYFDQGKVAFYDATKKEVAQASLPKGKTLKVVTGNSGLWSLSWEGTFSYVSNKGAAHVFENLGIKGPVPLFEANDTLCFLACDSVDPFGYRNSYGVHTLSPISELISTSSYEVNNANEIYQVPATENMVGKLEWDNINKRLWMCSEKDGILVITKNQRAYIIVDPAIPDELKGINYLKDVFLTDGLTWLCSTNGVYIIELKTNRFTHYLLPEANESNQIRGMCEDGKGNLMICDINGVHSVRIKDGKLNPISEQLNYVQYGFDILIENEKIFISTVDLAEYDIAKDELTVNKFWLTTYPKEYLIWDILRDESGKIWLGTSQGVGWLDEVKDTVKLSHPSGFTNYSDNTIYQFCQTASGEIWMPTTKGIYRFDKQKGMVDYHGEKAEGENYLPITKACHIHEDENEIFWIATRGAGLIKWNRKTNTYEQFTITEGLSTNVLYTILQDNYNNLWIGSDYGLIKFNKENYQVQTYTTDHGLSDNEFNRISCYKAKDGRMYFGSMRGVNAFYPEDFEEVEVFDAPLEIQEYRQFSGSADILKDRTQDLAQSKSIVLNPGDRFFTLKVQLLDYSSAKHNYSYMLEGVDNEWTYTSDNTIRVSNIPYGNYTLKIRGQNIAGQWSASELVIPVEVLAPFYRKTWFIITCFLIGIVTIYLATRLRVRALENDKKRLESVVQVRTADLKRSLQDKEVLLKEIHHRVKNNLQIISSLLELQSKGIDNEAALNAMTEGKNRVQSIALIHQKLYQNEDIATIELKEFIEDLCAQVITVFGYKVETEINIPSVSLDIDTAVPLGLISNELITNCYKYAFTKEKGGVLTISLDKESEGHYKLSFNDNGPGLPESFDFEKARSLGLRLVRRLSKQLGGHVEYRYANGARFEVHFKDAAARKSSM